jgi:hypothetical protein
MAQVEEVARKFNPDFTWKDVPVEAARIFVDRVRAFMQAFVLCDHLPGQPAGSGGIFGRVYRHMIRYEVQGRHSLHAHIMLWLSKADKTATGNEICACTPAIWDEEGQRWVVPAEYADSQAHSVQVNHVQDKHQHFCTEVFAPGCRCKGPCK